MSLESAFRVAGQQIGLNERDQNAALRDFLYNGGQNLDPATRAWCADFVNASLGSAGLEGTGSGMARSFLDWGEAVDSPRQGDVAVFSRGDPNGPYGHVGFFDGYNPDGTLRILGGNQGDAVSIANYSPDELLGFRRAPGSPANALSRQAPRPEPQNALARPELRLPDMRQDPAAFMNANPFTAMQFDMQPRNYLSRA